MTPNYPLTFINSATVEGNKDSWKTNPEILSCGYVATTPPLSVTIPREFGGPTRGITREGENSFYSPEDFYGMALANCFAATFQVFAKNSKVDFEKLWVRVLYTIKLNEKRLPVISGLIFEVNLLLADDNKRERASRLLDKVSKNCLIINSINVEKEFRIQVDND